MKVFALFLAVILVASCFKRDADEGGKVINLVSHGKVKGMDPIHTSDSASMYAVARVYEGLLQYSYLERPYKLVPSLAESMPKVSKDGLTYTFKIKKGVFFHHDPAFADGKGRELVAEDFVYSIKRLADTRLASSGWWLMEGKIAGLDEWRDKYAKLPRTDYSEEVAGLRAIDKYTLQFKLSRPFPQFLYSLTMPYTYAVPKEVVERYGKEFLNHPVGTGAFILPKFNQSNKIVYTKNPNYRPNTFPCTASPRFQHMADAYCGKQLPLVDKIVTHIMVEPQPAWLQFQKGNLDMMSIPKDNFSSIIPDAKNLSPEYDKKGMEFLLSPSLMISYVSFNNDLKLFQNADLRRAMALAFNVHEAGKLFYNGTTMMAQSIIPPGLAGYIEGYKNPYVGEGKPENIAEAKRLLARAGYPGGKGLPVITYDCSSGSEKRQKGEYFKAQMAQLGINIKVVQNTWPQFQKKIKNRQVMLHAIAWVADYPDGENFLQLLYGPNRSPGPNGSGYNDPKFNRLFKKAAVMQDSPARTDLYEKLNRMAAEAMPIMFLYYRQNYIIKNKWLKNVAITDYEQGIGMYMDVDTDLKKETLKSR